jgi:adhesin/invasin
VQVNQAVAAISVTPSTSTLTSVNETVQLAAAARDANDHPVTRPVTFAWSSDQTGVATVDATTGLVTAAGQGTATITAAAEGKSGTASVSVELAGYANWATITADPTGVEANNDDPSTITVRLFDSNGDPLGTSGGTVELSTTLGTLTTVVDLGDGTYTASVRSGVSGTAIVSGTLDGAPIADTAGVRFSTAAERATITADPTEVVANSDIPSVITVQLYNPDGTPRTTSGGTVQLLTNLGTMSSVTDLGNGSYSANLWSTVEGTALVTGTLNGVQIADSAQVLFTSPPPTITTIEVTPDTATLTVLGMTLQYTAVAKDASGNVVPNVLFTWFSSDTTVATIDATGVATAVADGHTTITAQSGSVTGSATLRVCTVTSAAATGGSAAPPVCQ